MPAGSSIHPPVLIIGLGNPILGDDGVGWRVAECIWDRLSKPDGDVYRRFTAADVEVDCLSLGGLALMERMVGYERVILIDAMELWDIPPGTIRCFPLGDLPQLSGSHLGSSHDTSLQSALQVGKEINAQLPDTILIIGIKINTTLDFSEVLSDPISQSVTQAADRVMELINDFTRTSP